MRRSAIYEDWTDGRVLQPDGYIRIKKRGPWRDWQEHRAIWCEVNGYLFVPPTHEVHHINRYRWDNDPKNLDLVEKAAHSTESNNYRWAGNSSFTIYEHLTEDMYEALYARGVRVPKILLDGIEWWERRWDEVPF